MELTRKDNYAMRALVYLAQQPPGQVIQASVISQTKSIPETSLIKIIQTLQKAGLLITTRDVQGYPAGLSLADVTRVPER